MQNGLLAKKFVSYRTTGYDNCKGSFDPDARLCQGSLFACLLQKRHIRCRKENRTCVVFAYKYVKID